MTSECSATTTTTPPDTELVQDPCPVCLEEYSDKAFVKSCFHAFCFTCIVQWSEITQTCPICKAPFQAVIHNVNSVDEYTTFSVGPAGTRQEVKDETRYRQRFSARRNKHTLRVVTKSKRKPANEARRKAIYVAGLKAQPPCSTDKVQRVRDISLSFFKKNPAAVHRLLPWISRDVKVLLGEDHVEFMLQLILSMLDKVNLDSKEFVDNIRPFILERTDHFIHELTSFAQSPLDLVAYDNKVIYEFPKRTDDLMTSTSGECSSAMAQQHSHSYPGNCSSDQSDRDEIRQKILFELHASDFEQGDYPFLNTSSHGTQDELLNECSSTDTSIVDDLTVTELSQCKSKGKRKGPINKPFKPKVSHSIEDVIEISSSDEDSNNNHKCHLKESDEVVCLSPLTLTLRSSNVEKLESNEKSLPEKSVVSNNAIDTKELLSVSQSQEVYIIKVSPLRIFCDQTKPSRESRELDTRKRHKRKLRKKRRTNDLLSNCLSVENSELQPSNNISKRKQIDECSTKVLQNELQCIDKELEHVKGQLLKALLKRENGN